MTDMRRIGVVLCLFPLLLATACSGGKKDAGLVQQPAPVAKMYDKAAAELQDGEYSEAAKGFNDVEQNYPYSEWATRAQMMAAYAYYKSLKYDDAVMALDQFIELHPGDPSVAYAYYIKALCYYEQISDVQRDQQMTQKALAALRQVRERFPDTPYARDADLKIDLTLDHLAGKEMEIGRYYLNHQDYQAAINRFETVVTQYQTTTQVPEALERLVEAYTALGIKAQALKSAAILGQNFPQSQWYRNAYKIVGPQAPAPAPNSVYDKTLGKIF
ncbi:MAG: outer membrane protein assembly factor BamD [Alphaproteobacteria bacterium]|nr:outer membrane protein assembly factor BamD [Alphaproteobacteria bacterium]MDE2336002.1 outer membrane protein assembly factor BamD [Alphaproteobacteria bacterium]